MVTDVILLCLLQKHGHTFCLNHDKQAMVIRIQCTAIRVGRAGSKCSIMHASKLQSCNTGSITWHHAGMMPLDYSVVAGPDWTHALCIGLCPAVP